MIVVYNRGSFEDPAGRKAGQGLSSSLGLELAGFDRAFGMSNEGCSSPVRETSASGLPFTFNTTHSRPQIRQDYPLNLSISISGGKETKQDSPSNGE